MSYSIPLLTLQEYAKIKNYTNLKNEDCFCQIKSNTITIEEYFKKNINNFVFTNEENTKDIWGCCFLDRDTSIEVINNNPTLSKINEIIEISSCFIMKVSPNSWVPWHYDIPKKGPALNLLLTPKDRSLSIFTSKFPEASNVIECNYMPHQFCLYNTEIIHSVLNLSDTRYLFSATFERGKTDLTWDLAKHYLSEFII